MQLLMQLGLQLPICLLVLYGAMVKICHLYSTIAILKMFESALDALVKSWYDYMHPVVFIQVYYIRRQS